MTCKKLLLFCLFSVHFLMQRGTFSVQRKGSFGIIPIFIRCLLKMSTLQCAEGVTRCWKHEVSVIMKAKYMKSEVYLRSDRKGVKSLKKQDIPKMHTVSLGHLFTFCFQRIKYCKKCDWGKSSSKYHHDN